MFVERVNGEISTPLRRVDMPMQWEQFELLTLDGGFIAWEAPWNQNMDMVGEFCVNSYVNGEGGVVICGRQSCTVSCVLGVLGFLHSSMDFDAIVNTYFLYAR